MITDTTPWLNQITGWQIAATVFGLIIGIRLFLAPYWIHKKHIHGTEDKAQRIKRAIAPSLGFDDEALIGTKCMIVNLVLKNTSDVEIETGRVLATLTHPDIPTQAINGDPMKLRKGEDKHYARKLGEKPIDRREGTVIATVVIPFGFPDQPPSRVLEAVIQGDYQIIPTNVVLPRGSRVVSEKEYAVSPAEALSLQSLLGTAPGTPP